MSGDVQQTLLELERKLRELQAELAQAGAPGPAAHPQAERPYVQPPVAHQPPPAPPPVPPAPNASPLQGQLDELLRFRDQLTAAADKLVEDYSRLLEHVERAAQVAAPAPTAPGHATFPVPPPTPSSPEGAMFAGQVHIEAGPFADIGAVAAFESALRSIAQAQEVHVRSFDDGHAVFGLRLAGEVALVFELRRASDQGFDVRHAEPGRLVLALHAPGDLPFPMRP